MKHSKITAIVLTLCMLVTLMVVAPTAASATTDANFVKDGSFEKWGITGEQDHWLWVVPGANLDKEIPASTATMELVGSEKVSGNYALRFKATGNQNPGTHYVSQNVGKFDAGTKIKMSIMAKVVQAENVTGYLRLIGREGGPVSGNNGIAVVANSTTVASTDWKEYSITYTVSADNATKDQHITFELSNSTDFEVYLDDFKVEIVEEAVTKPSVANGDFENGSTGWIAKGGDIVEGSDGNHYLELDAHFSDRYIQVIKNLTPDTLYVISFDVCTSGAYAYVDDECGTTFLANYSTNGEWERHHYEFRTSTANKDATSYDDTTQRTLRLMYHDSGAGTTGQYARFDNVVLTEVNNDTNNDFEFGNMAGGWTKENKTPTVKTDGSNYYVELDVAVEGIQRELIGLTPGQKYIASFDVWSNTAAFYCDTNGTLGKAGSLFGDFTNNSQWENHHFTWTQPEGQTTGKIRFRCQGSGFVEGESCVRLDNLIVKELDPSVLIYNGGFEYGANGLGEMYVAGNGINFNAGTWKTSGTGTYSQVNGGMGGTKALQIVRTEATSYAQVQYDVSVTAGEKYIFTTYVKPGTGFTALEEGSAQFYLAATNTTATNGTASDYPTKVLEPGDGWTPFTLVFTANATATTSLRMRTYGGGTILFDNFSLRKIDSNSLYVDYTGTNGEFSESLVDGGKVTITMPAVAADQGNVYALALYNKNGANKTLLNVKAQTITDANVTAGYASFTLAADTLGADFANVNYAKLIMLKGGSYDAIREYDLLLKAAQ